MPPADEHIVQATQRAERCIRDKLTERGAKRRKQTDVGTSLSVIGLPCAATDELPRRNEWFNVGVVARTRANEGYEVWLDPATMRVQMRRERP